MLDTIAGCHNAILSKSDKVLAFKTQRSTMASVNIRHYRLPYRFIRVIKRAKMLGVGETMKRGLLLLRGSSLKEQVGS